MNSMAIRFFHLSYLFILAAVVTVREKAPALIGYPLTAVLLSEVKLEETRPQGTYPNNTWVVADENDKLLGYFISGHQVSRTLIPKQ